MLEALGQDAEISQYIRHFWISTQSPSRDKELYRKIKDEYKDNSEELLAFSKQLSKEAELYSSIIDPQLDSHAKGIYQLICDINKLRIRQCYPLILAALAQKVPTKDLRNLLHKIVTVALRRGITDKNPNEVETLFATSASKIRTEGVKALGSIIENLDSFSSTDKEIRGFLEENRVSEIFARFILEHLERSKSTDEKEIFRPTLEHILPQSPQNMQDWNITKAEHDTYAYKIGNLTLVGKTFNSSMSNKPFEQKRIELLKSDIKIAKEIAEEYSSWGKSQIDERGSEILEFVFKQWPKTS
ncbi:MAG TPA: HNH endonuclease family protein [Candidatus Paceibacterota bacterium]|nr:HNH endonuclease family protein [Candidatus Paceibacterota bacterium]